MSKPGFLATCALLCGALSACNDDPNNGSCAAVTGVFVASYQMLEGSCGTFSPNTLKVEDDDRGTVTKLENRLSDNVTTTYIFKGCTVGIKQSVENMGTKLSDLAGDLEVQDERELSGMMTRTEYMPDGSISCHGVYDAHYRRQDLVIGGAVQHAETAP